MLPNFLGIGVPRSATTWIYECLDEHPDVFVPEKKELFYFNWNLDKGPDWYRNWFKNAKGYKAVGEYSPDYIYYEKVLERIQNVLGKDVKFLLSLRDPVKRAYSMYGLHIRGNEHSLEFEDALEEYESYIERGFYFKHIQKFLEFFPEDSLLILLFEEINSAPDKCMKKVFEFLGVDSDFIPEKVNQRINRGVTNRDSINLRLFNFVSNQIQKYKITRNAVNVIKRNSLVNKFLEKFVFSSSQRKINPELERELAHTFLESNRKLAEYLNRDLSKYWTYP